MKIEIELDQLEKLNRKIRDQAAEIRRLNGATNHACGTPLSIAVKALEKISGSDFRGNRPTECVIAFEALKEIRSAAGS